MLGVINSISDGTILAFACMRRLCNMAVGIIIIIIIILTLPAQAGLWAACV